jgi:ribose transport system permease protein
MSVTSVEKPAPPARRPWAAVRALTVELPWIWVFLAVVGMWVAIAAISGRGLVGTMLANIALAPFLVFVGIGQMFVITSGNGNIDLSVQYSMPLAAFVGISVMSGGSGSAVVGVLAAVAVGLVIAAANLFCILVLGIPAIVATLSVGLMAYSGVSLEAQSFSAVPDPGLHAFTVSSVAGVSWLAIVCLGLAFVAGGVLHRTTYGRALQAAGQNRSAANLAGLPVTRVVIVSYLICGVLAALSGLLLGIYVSPSVSIGIPYLLNSIAVVVLGGSLIAGGRSNVVGVWGGALFLLLLTTLLNVVNIAVASQDIVKGALIIVVLALVGTKESS